MSAPNIVIVGGGIGGLLLATRLGRTLGRSGQARISLVDRAFTHVWKPMLHTIAAGTRDINAQRVPFLSHAQQNGYSFEPGEFCGLDRTDRRVLLASISSARGAEVIGPRSLHYDLLVLALGSGANDFGVPGVRDHCHFIDSQAQAESFNEALRTQLLRAAIHDTEVRVGIVGAGATGVELAAELSHLLEVASGFGDARMRQRLHLSLYESGSRVLGAFPPKISEASQRVLQRLGFRVQIGSRVEAAVQDGLMVQGSGLAPADLTVWAAGVKAPAVLGALSGLETNRLMQLQTAGNLQCVGDERIFALGDCASVTPEGFERPLPPTAQVAAQQAAHLARHLPAWRRGQPVPAFVYRDLGALVSLGKYSAYGTLGSAGMLPGQFIRGRLAQWGHAWLYRRHQIALHGPARAALGWLAEGTARMVQPDVRLS